MPRGGKGLIIHTEAYDGPDNPYAGVAPETPTYTCFHCDRALPMRPLLPRSVSSDMAICYHCTATVIFEPKRTRARGSCHACHEYTCDACTATGTCPYQRHVCRSCDAYICEECKAVEVSIGCHPFAQTIDLALQYRDANISAVRPHGQPLPDEQHLAEVTRPHSGITLPTRPSVEYGTTHMGSDIAQQQTEPRKD